MEWLTSLCNVVFKTAKMSENWRWSTMISLYKNTSDIRSCYNYRGHQVAKLHYESLEQDGGDEVYYRSQSSCKETGGVVYRRKKDLYMVFTDLEKEYDKVPIEVFMEMLGGRSVYVVYTRVIKDMYDGIKTRVRIMGGDSEKFSVVMGLH
ncbi:uncharacterized protein LOC132628733 [Lycium barbarum]|uniref:uncharacterized protein LOC132628733 n=1 Tax=Lycium barbarum TaxID=112863 RepID=UPI00293F4BA6|nr:uncharacterized protein LOC132628733 [Lycium barbarum]